MGGPASAPAFLSDRASRVAGVEAGPPKIFSWRIHAVVNGERDRLGRAPHSTALLA